MALKKTENIIIGFDTKTNEVKILRNVGDNFRDVMIEHFVIDEQLPTNQSVSELLNKALSNYTAEHQIRQADVYIVLPDHLVTIQQLSLPLMSKSKLKDLVKSELQKTYPNFFELETNITTISKSKKQITYSATIVDKIILQDCVSICKKYNLNLRSVSYSSNCLVNSVLALAPKTKHANFLLLDVQEKQSKLIYVSHDRTICFGILPFGENFFEGATKPDDYVASSHSLREVFNSTESLLQTTGSSGTTLEEMEQKAFDAFCEKHSEEQMQKQNFVAEFAENYTKFSTFANFAKNLQEIVAKNYFLPKPENLFVNIDPKLFEEHIKDRDFDIKIQLLQDELPEKCMLGAYLELYGAIYAGTFNAGQNFLDKESKASDVVISTKAPKRGG